MSLMLTVCIPTYNRVSELIQCLSSVEKAIAFLSTEQRDQVVVIISDNASQDQTKVEMDSHHNSFPWLKYHRNTSNIGAEANFLGLIQMSQSEYVWVLGDDDRMMPDALSVVLGRLSSDYDLLICNCSTYSRGFAAQRKSHYFSLRGDKEFQNPAEVMRTFGIELGYISVQIFRKARFLAVNPAEYQAFAEYGHSFMYGIYLGLLPHSKTAYIDQPLIASQGSDSITFDWYKFFAIGTAIVFETLQAKGYSSRSVLAGKHQALRDSILPHTLVCKRDGKDLPRDLFRLMLPHYNWNWLFWVGMIILLLPRSIFRFFNSLNFRSRICRQSLT